MSRYFNFGFSAKKSNFASNRKKSLALLDKIDEEFFEREELFGELCERLPERLFNLLPCLKYVFFADVAKTWAKNRAEVRRAVSDSDFMNMFNELDQKLYDLKDGIFFVGKRYFEKHCPNEEPEDIFTQAECLSDLLNTID